MAQQQTRIQLNQLWLACFGFLCSRLDFNHRLLDTVVISRDCIGVILLSRPSQWNNIPISPAVPETRPAVTFRACCHFISLSKVSVTWDGGPQVTSVWGEESGEAMEHTELIFIIGMGSFSSLHWAFTLSAVSQVSFFTGVWRSEKGKITNSHY